MRYLTNLLKSLTVVRTYVTIKQLSGFVNPLAGPGLARSEQTFGWRFIKRSYLGHRFESRSQKRAPRLKETRTELSSLVSAVRKECVGNNDIFSENKIDQLVAGSFNVGNQGSVGNDAVDVIETYRRRPRRQLQAGPGL